MAASVLAVALILTPATVGSAFAAIIYTADNQSATTTFETAKDITLTGSGPEFAILTNPANGVLSNFNATTGFVTYTPNAAYDGPDSFTFKTTDGVDDSDPATVDITVRPQPQSASQAVTTEYFTAIDLQLEVVNGATFDITVQPQHGSLQNLDNVAGTLTYVPDINFSGQDSFTFVTTDGVNTSAPATVTITVKQAVGNGGFYAVTTRIAENLAKIEGGGAIPESSTPLYVAIDNNLRGVLFASMMAADWTQPGGWNGLTEGQQAWLLENFDELVTGTI